MSAVVSLQTSLRGVALAALSCALAACDGAGPSDVVEPPRAYPTTTSHQSGVILSGGLVTESIGEACVECHEDVAEAYASSGMHEFVTLPTGEGSIEARLLGREVVDPDTGITGTLELGDGHYVQKMLYRDPDGVERASFSMRVDLVIGSGHAARSYLVAKDGYMFELPLTWYAELDALSLSPGPGFKQFTMRHATHMCVGCHVGFIEPADGRDMVGFRGSVSLGIGCARCHGSAEEHCDTGDPLHVANPSRMDADRQAEVCAQCHLSGAVSLVKRGFAFSAYTPGERLGTVHGVFEPLGGKEDRGTSIAGHAGRMKLSRCFQESDAMTCTTCHNPHRGHKSEVAAADTASGCLVCHQEDACHGDPVAREGKTCSQCHMASVPSNDIAHTRTTDHFIQRRPPPHVARAGTHEEQSVGAYAVRDVELVNVLDPHDELPGSRVLKARAYLEGVDMASDVLGRRAPGYIARASAIVDEVLAKTPDDHEALLLRATVLYVLQRERAAVNQLDPLIARSPDWAMAVKLRAFLALKIGPADEAETWLRRALELSKYDDLLTTRLAQLLETRGRPADALTVLERLRAETGPTDDRAAIGGAIAWRAQLYGRGVGHAYDRLMFRPRDPQALTDAADMCRMAGAPERQTRVLYDEALRLAPEAPRPLIGLARLELREGHREAAREILRRLERIAPAAPEVRELAAELRG